MKLTKLTIPALLALVFVLTECSPSKKAKESDDTDSVATSTAKDDIAVIDTVLLEEYEVAKVAWFETIKKNDDLISSLKSSIQSEKLEVRAPREQKLKLMDLLNAKQKTKIALFKPDNQEHWTRFELMIDEDLSEINAELKALKK